MNKSLIIIFSLSIFITACNQQNSKPEPLDLSLCEYASGVCKELCANCSEFNACMAADGECPVAAVANNFWIDDNTDGGDDMWTAGCHYSYSNNACSLNQRFHRGDLCVDSNPKLLIEWTNAACHAPQGDVNFYDCDKECKKKGLGGGSCSIVKNACGNNRDSAKCECIANPS